MSDYQPKVGDRVMVGEHGPYEAKEQVYGRYVILDIGAGEYVGEAHPDWLTPAPEPEPDEPTAFGALVELKRGLVAARTTGSDDFPWFITGSKALYSWAGVREKGVVRVILTNPADVETLQAQVDEALRQRDELQQVMVELAPTSTLDQLVDLQKCVAELRHDFTRIADIAGMHSNADQGES